MQRYELEDQRRSFDLGDGVILDVVRTDPYGYWYFKKHGNNVNVPEILKDQAFTGLDLAQRAAKSWVLGRKSTISKERAEKGKVS